MKKLTVLSVIAFILMATSPLDFAQAQQSSQAQGGYGGNGNDRVTVCRETNSRFLPFVKVTLPEFVADRWIEQERAQPADSNGNCPEAETTLRDFIKEKLDSIFGRLRN